jgi:signal transduction histidine kinase
MTELMRVSEMKKAKLAECFQMIYSNSSDMLELINNLLDIAKIEAGKFELMKQKSDIKKLIESRILFFDIAAKDAKVKLTSCFGKDIPDNVEFDARTISQVLNNLISNAMKFTKENGSVAVQTLLHKNGESLEKEAKDAGIVWFIKKDISDTPDSLVVAVTDNGIGIAPDQINKLFNKFVQAKSTFVQKGGTGLGLAIIKSIVDSHGGVVGVESVEGQGTTFYFTLPTN